MFLKCLDINGFKSFADKTHIDFSDGITSLLGPNGCGKSNIVDSIKWVLGEQSTKTLRAGRMEDVIFNGTDTRKPLQFAEVALTIDNSEHKLQTDLSEIEIKRRVFRTGESEYYLNRQRCLLKNIRELFFDTGIGKSAYSILEQGKIDQILSSKPEDRRYIFEEAAGISRFKAECNEAQKKIDRTDENIAQVESIIAAEKRTYNSLKNQAEKAMSYNELVKRQLELDVTLHAIKIRTFTNLKAVRAEQKASNQKRLEELNASLDGFRTGIEEEQVLVREKNRASFDLQSQITKDEEAINSRNERIRILEEQYREYIRSRDEFSQKIEGFNSMIERDRRELEQNEESIADKEELLEESSSQLAHAHRMIQDDLARVDEENACLEKEEQSILVNEQRIGDLSQELKKVIEDLALELDEKMGEEYSFARRKGFEDDLVQRIDVLSRRLGEKAAFYRGLPEGTDIHERLDSDFKSIISSVEAIRQAFLDYRGSIPPFIDSLLAPEGLLTRKRSIAEEEEECRESIARSRTRIAACRQTIATLSQEIEGLRETVKTIEVKVASMKASLDSARQIAQNIRRSIEETTASLDDAQTRVAFYDGRISDTDHSIRQAEEEKAELVDRISDARGRLQGVMEEIRSLNSQLEDRQKAKDQAIETIHLLRNEIEKSELWSNQADEQISMLFSGFLNTYSRSLGEYKETLESDDLPDQTLVENELGEVRRQIAALGPNINHMAVDDFKEAQERYDFYTKQLDDLNKAKADLEKVLAEIQEKSIQMFMTTYKQISDNFQAMFKRLFNGGRAEITLADEENVLTSGIDIFAQPPGKKLISLTLLSGGERSMTAVALLFATYLVKPSPFCILDEIDAALDDKNIGYFLNVLEDFSQTSQFIIITHNTHTVMGSQSLLGVTQMEAGVSTTVTYKLANIAGEAVILDEDDERVDFDKDGKRKAKS